jgi:hypothetical protein
MTRTLLCIGLAFLLAAPALAQTSMSSTTLSAAVAVSDNTVTVASATGITARSTSVNTLLYVDQELMEVVSLDGAVVRVIRGLNRTRVAAHASGATVWFGAPRSFSSADPAGTCTAAATGYSPRIVPSTGSMWYCYSSVWTRYDLDLQRYQITTLAAPGNLRLIRSEILANYQGSIASGNLVGVRGAVTLATGTTNAGAYIYGVQGKVITGAATLNQGSTFTAGVFGQLDVSGGTLTAGHIASVIGEVYGLSTGTASALDIFYAQHAGGGVANSFLKAFGKTTYVFDLESNVHTQMGTTGAATTAAGWLKINVNGSTRYINLWSTAP